MPHRNLYSWSFAMVTALIIANRPSGAFGQIVQFSPSGDSTQKVSMSAYVDGYFCYDFENPAGYDIPYFVSQNRHNEFNINLTYLKIKYTSSRARATVMPAFGTFMNSNYASEKNTLQHIVEASVGVKLFQNRDIWLDAGVIASPFTFESEISFDQLTLTRSLGPEYVPYFMTGARLTLPVADRFTANLFLLNGWQVISDVNNPLAFGSQFEYAPSDEWTIDLNTFYGDQVSSATPHDRIRTFLDAYATYNQGAWNMALGASVGNQRRSDSLAGMTDNVWWHMNAAAKYAITAVHSVSGRIEHFHDPNSVMITPVTGGRGFTSSSISLGYNLAVTPAVLVRAEVRYFQSPDKVFEGPAAHNAMLTTGFTAKF